MNFKSISNLSDDIRRNLSSINNLGFDLVVGIPRSGMIPAYAIALYLNIDCTDVVSFINNTPLKKGGTRTYNNKITSPHEARKVLVVDDSIDSGKSMDAEVQKIPVFLREKITTLAIYSSRSNRNDVDLFLEYVPHPRVFEWNIFHHPVLQNACVDIDGVLCRDPTPVENDDGVNYRKFLLNAEPLFIPSEKINSLVTSRLEKYRPETELWLKKHNVKYDNLIMLDLPSKEQRIRMKAHTTHKASHYKKSTTFFFIESEFDQAINICKKTGKPVYCVDTNQLFTSSIISSLLINPSQTKIRVLKKIKRLVDKVIFRLKKHSH